jgi:hypothetical protein
MTPDLIFILTKGQTLVEVPAIDRSLIKVPQWKANGAPSLNAWVRQQASGAAPSAPQGAGPMKQPAATNGTQQPQAPTADPVLRHALSDPDYKLPTPKMQSGVTPAPAMLDQQKATVQAKQILRSQGKPVVGLYGAVVAQAARALGYNNVDATNCHIRKWRII